MKTYAGVLGDAKCECADKGCKAHTGVGDCRQVAVTVLYRIDMEDNSGTWMCDACADDAYESGLFVDHDYDEDEECDCVPCSNCGGVEQADDCTEHNAIDRHIR